MARRADEVFRPKFNRVSALVIWGFAAVFGISVLLTADLDYYATGLPVIALFAFAAWTALWRPCVYISDDGVALVNVTRTVQVPWPALIQVDTRYALTLMTPRATHSAWAAPAPGRPTTRRAIQRNAPERDDVERVRPGDLPATNSGDAAHLVRTRWDILRHQEAIELGAADQTQEVVHWHSLDLVIWAGLLLAAFAPVLL